MYFLNIENISLNFFQINVNTFSLSKTTEFNQFYVHIFYITNFLHTHTHNFTVNLETNSTFQDFEKRSYKIKQIYVLRLIFQITIPSDTYVPHCSIDISISHWQTYTRQPLYTTLVIPFSLISQTSLKRQQRKWKLKGLSSWHHATVFHIPAPYPEPAAS